MEFFYVYMLRCRDGKYYVGQTDDIEKRMAEHEDGTFPGFTSARRPVTFVWATRFATRDEAVETEHKLKSWSRAKKEALIAGDWPELKRLARGPNRPSSAELRTGPTAGTDSE